jgi:hypothetical protein
MNLNDYKKSIDEIKNQKVEVVRSQNTSNYVSVKKNILLSYVSDATGCGHIRNIFPMTYLNAIFGKEQQVMPIISPIFIWQEDILARTKSILFQRQMAPEHYNLILRYKELQPKYGFKMVYDIDDFIWGHNEKQGGDKEDGVPSYNFGWHGITEPVKKYSVEIMKLMDKITVTSEYLRFYINKVLDVNVPVEIVPNAIPMYFWGNTKRKQIKKPITKPRIVYTGSPTHYSNQERLLGDFENAYKEFIIKNVLENKIEFIVMGDCPWFFEGIKDKIQVIGWLNSYQYHLGVKAINADFAIGPLVRNNFNYSKSYIKYQEMCAIGIPFIGSVFTNGKPSPYDICELKVTDNCKVEDLEKIVFGLSNNLDEYNNVMKKQYDWMDRSGGYLESPKYVQMLLDNYF